MKSTTGAFLEKVVGLPIQACGALHLANFGAFASTERSLP